MTEFVAWREFYEALDKRLERQTNTIKQAIRDAVTPVEVRIQAIETDLDSLQKEHDACGPLREGFNSGWKTIRGIASKLFTGTIVVLVIYLLRLFLRPEVFEALKQAGAL